MLPYLGSNPHSLQHFTLREKIPGTSNCWEMADRVGSCRSGKPCQTVCTGRF